MRVRSIDIPGLTAGRAFVPPAAPDASNAAPDAPARSGTYWSEVDPDDGVIAEAFAEAKRAAPEHARAIDGAKTAWWQGVRRMGQKHANAVLGLAIDATHAHASGALEPVIGALSDTVGAGPLHDWFCNHFVHELNAPNRRYVERIEAGTEPFLPAPPVPAGAGRVLLGRICVGAAEASDSGLTALDLMYSTGKSARELLEEFGNGYLKLDQQTWDALNKLAETGTSVPKAAITTAGDVTKTGIKTGGDVGKGGEDSGVWIVFAIVAGVVTVAALSMESEHKPAREAAL